MSATQIQLSLFDIKCIYANHQGALTNEAVYTVLKQHKKIPAEALQQKAQVGATGEKHNLIKRKVRWFQQTLKQLGVIERVGRGSWRLASQNKAGLHIIPENLSLLAFSTKLGMALWSNCSVFRKMNEPVHLCLTSPPYPLKNPRSYGNVCESEWIDFLCFNLDGIVKTLIPGGSLVLNVSNDIFQSKSPARSLYLERMVLALHDRLGLELMDRIPWVNPCKPPAPTVWACMRGLQLAVTWEPIFWFSNDHNKVRSNNRRVLQPHTKQHKKFLAQGNQRITNYGDGAYQLRTKSFSRQTEGRLPRNVLTLSHNCASSRKVRKAAKDLNVKAHSGMFPLGLPEFFIRFLTEENELVIDPFAGSFKTCLAAEKLNRRWLGSECVLEYIQQGQALIHDFCEEH